MVAPIGAAILGLAEGQTIEWPQPDGHTMKVTIEKVLYQPESEGIISKPVEHLLKAIAIWLFVC